MDWPESVLRVLDALTHAGYDAWAVGGCVRDMLLKRVPNDWDVCTQASPDEMKAALSGLRLIETGLKHGTLTALAPDPIEVTTYRIDGGYQDHRRPDQVIFVSDLAQDLARRDFTVNAMAMRPDVPIVDLYGGRQDLERRIIRCVGSPEKRFDEDALRMLRCLRFASQLDFSIEDDTARALRSGWAALSYVSRERIGAEYLKLLVGPGAARVLTGFREEISRETPLRDDIDLGNISLLPEEPGVRMGFLFRDDGCLEGLRLDRKLTGRVRALCALRTRETPENRYALLRLMNEAGADAVRDLLFIWRAQGRETDGARRMLDEILARGDCWRIGDLRVTGRDLAGLGIHGTQTGNMLRELLDAIMAGALENDHDALMRAAEKLNL